LDNFLDKYLASFYSVKNPHYILLFSKNIMPTRESDENNKKDISCNTVVPTISRYSNMTVEYNLEGVSVSMDISYVLERGRIVFFTHE